MNHDLIDGVPVLWADAPGPLEATLIFACGARDETLRTLGVTHLIEHLAMSTLPRLHHDHNASVDLSLTQFTCSGRPEQVADFLTRVCTALGDLPLGRVDQEAGVLAAEDGRVADPQTAELLSHRYGAQGPGLAAYRGPGPDRIPLEAVRETVTRYFHRTNATLVLTGPPPAGLRLPLPAGTRPDRTATQPVLHHGPSWRQEQVPGPGLALHGDLEDFALALATKVLAERLRETVRHQHGLSYEVDGGVVFTGPGQGERTICLDAREGQEQKVAELLWAETLRLAREGMTEQELAEEVAAAREAWEDPRSIPYELGEAAADALLGESYLDAPTRLAAMAAVTPEQARQALAAALGTALVVVPCEVELDLRQLDGTPLPQQHCPGGVTELPSGGQVFRPPLTERLRYSAARKTKLVVTDTGLHFQEPDGTVHHVAYSEVAAVEMNGPGRVVFGRNTCLVPAIADLFADLGPAVRAIDAAVPAELRYPASAFRPVD